MTPEGIVDSEGWFERQISVIAEVFESASRELEASGIRLRAGSESPKREEFDSIKKVSVRPLRLLNSDQGQSLSLSLSATKRRGVARYVVAMELSGELTCQALKRLVTEYPDIWAKAFVRVGLWIGEGVEAKLLNETSQISQGGSRICLAGVFLRSDLSKAIEDGVMIMGLLYRSILDEVSGAGKMHRLYAQLRRSESYQRATFQRMVRP